ncbi:MAG: T9SS type A sorting domain-containing protein, partial [Bacteroidales bacterium]
DTNANILWQKTFGGSSYDLPMDMLMLEHNHYVVAGSSQSPISGDKTENTRGGRDYWILEISTTMSIEDFSPQRMHVFPNPVADFVTVELPENSTSGQLYVFDITSTIVHSEIINAESNQVNLSNIPSGVYFISYFDESGIGWSAEVQKL